MLETSAGEYVTLAANSKATLCIVAMATSYFVIGYILAIIRKFL